MPIIPPIPAVNQLLSALPDTDRAQFLAACEPVTLSFCEILAEPGEIIHHVYFPTKGFISLMTRSDYCPRLEVGLIGDEGMLGTSLLLGVDKSPMHALVQGAGAALRMPAATFLHELESSRVLQQILLRYVHVVMEQLGQTAACTHYHLVEARLARWLLMTQDRAHSDTFDVKHEFLAYMLGVRRAGISKAAGSLQHRELIRYSRGHMRILDRHNLEIASCGCYTADKGTYEHTMSMPPSQVHEGAPMS